MKKHALEVSVSNDVYKTLVAYSDKYSVPMSIIANTALISFFENPKHIGEVKKERIVINDTKKRCSECRKIKNIDSFYVDKSGCLNRRSQCRDCYKKNTFAPIPELNAR